jgi:hypothetical protein
MGKAFMDDGSDGQVEFIQGGPDEPFSGMGISLGFCVADIDATTAIMKLCDFLISVRFSAA